MSKYFCFILLHYLNGKAAGIHCLWKWKLNANPLTKMNWKEMPHDKLKTYLMKTVKPLSSYAPIFSACIWFSFLTLFSASHSCVKSVSFIATNCLRQFFNNDSSSPRGKTDSIAIAFQRNKSQYKTLTEKLPPELLHLTGQWLVNKVILQEGVSQLIQRTTKAMTSDFLLLYTSFT